VEGRLGAPHVPRGCGSVRRERQLDRSAITGAVAAPQESGIHEARDEPARAAALAHEPVADLTDRQRVFGVPQDRDHLTLRRGEAGRAQELGECPSTLALGAQDEVSKLLGRFHGPENI